MKKRKKKTGNRRGVQLLTLCISTMMVLVLIGLVVFSVLTSRNLSAWVKENLTVTVMLGDDAGDNDAKRLRRDLIRRPFAKDIAYVSKETALKEMTQELGYDPSEFAGVNPFVPKLELRLTSEYANRDSLAWIAQELEKDPRVAELAYQMDLIDDVNKNLGFVNLILLGLAVLLTFISYTLISNTVRLSVYSRRFLIHTEKLVGASWSFIRRPFLQQALMVGVIAALLAIAVLGVLFYSLYYYEPGILTVITWRELTFTAVAVLLFGMFITVLCSWLSVNHYLEMTAGDLYRI